MRCQHVLWHSCCGPVSYRSVRVAFSDRGMSDSREPFGDPG